MTDRERIEDRMREIDGLIDGKDRTIWSLQAELNDKEKERHELVKEQQRLESDLAELDNAGADNEAPEDE